MEGGAYKTPELLCCFLRVSRSNYGAYNSHAIELLLIVTRLVQHSLYIRSINTTNTHSPNLFILISNSPKNRFCACRADNVFCIRFTFELLGDDTQSMNQEDYVGVANTIPIPR
jgi:hypothetical protein